MAQISETFYNFALQPPKLAAADIAESVSAVTLSENRTFSTDGIARETLILTPYLPASSIELAVLRYFSMRVSDFLVQLFGSVVRKSAERSCLKATHSLFLFIFKRHEIPANINKSLLTKNKQYQSN